MVAEVAPSQLPDLRPDEDVTVTARSGEVLQVTRDVVEQLGRERDVNEDCNLHAGNQRPFAQWLWNRLGMAYPSSLGSAVEIERRAEQADVPATEMFFELLDEFRPAGPGAHQVKPDGQASTEAEQPQQSD
uniref:hypothetical protein n=1 Tax=Streptomyces scabiei TaxID=1930 RepID=UPI001F456B20|nr:hypothetical protein [Streptomyces scabiei]